MFLETKRDRLENLMKKEQRELENFLINNKRKEKLK